MNLVNFFSLQANLWTVVPSINNAARLVGAKHLKTLPLLFKYSLILLISVVLPAPGGPLINHDLFESNILFMSGSKLLSGTSGVMSHGSVCKV